VVITKLTRLRPSLANPTKGAALLAPWTHHPSSRRVVAPEKQLSVDARGLHMVLSAQPESSENETE
jgi:hypothetical protein